MVTDAESGVFEGSCADGYDIEWSETACLDADKFWFYCYDPSTERYPTKMSQNVECLLGNAEWIVTDFDMIGLPFSDQQCYEKCKKQLLDTRDTSDNQAHCCESEIIETGNEEDSQHTCVLYSSPDIGTQDFIQDIRDGSSSYTAATFINFIDVGLLEVYDDEEWLDGLVSEVTDEDRLIATGLLMYLKMIKDKVEQDSMNAEGDL